MAKKKSTQISEDKSLNYRKDNREKAQFEMDVALHTKKEKFMLDLWVKQQKLAGIKIVVKDNGVDNSGKFVKRSNSNADYLLTIDGKEVLAEIKTSPVSSKCKIGRASCRERV